MYNVTLRLIHVTNVAMEKLCVTYSECVSVSLVIQRAMHMHHVVICGLSGSNMFFHITSQTVAFFFSFKVTECVF